MIEIYLDMCHDTVSLSVSSRFVLRSVFLRLHAHFSVSLVCVGDPDTSVFVESVQCRNESIGRHPVSRVVQRTLESTQLSLLVSTLLPVLSTRLEIWNSRGMCKDLFRGTKVNEFADLTTSEFVSEYPPSDFATVVVTAGRVTCSGPGRRSFASRLCACGTGTSTICSSWSAWKVQIAAQWAARRGPLCLKGRSGAPSPHVEPT